MIEKFKQLKEIEKIAVIPLEEHVVVDLNFSGVAVNSSCKKE